MVPWRMVSLLQHDFAVLQEQLPNIQLKGLLALTPELPDRSISTTEKHQLQFEVLSDETK
jgi:peroxiredoxin